MSLYGFALFKVKHTAIPLLTFCQTLVYSPVFPTHHVSRPSCYRWAPAFAQRVSSSPPSAVSEQLLPSYSGRSSFQQTPNTTRASSVPGCTAAAARYPEPDNTQLHTPLWQQQHKNPITIQHTHHLITRRYCYDWTIIITEYAITLKKGLLHCFTSLFDTVLLLLTQTVKKCRQLKYYTKNLNLNENLKCWFAL